MKNVKRLTIKEINEICEKSDDLGEDFLAEMKEDSRAGVKKIYERYRRRYREKEHLEELFSIENELRGQSYDLLAGVDEAGRGPLAGPVVAAAVVLPEFAMLPGLNDSKKLSSFARQKMSLEIKKIAIDWSLGLSTVNEILCYNIHRASLLAMKRAIFNLSLSPGYLLIDGYNLDDVNIPQQRLVGGDGRSASVAAASVIAKVTRDELMEVLHNIYPEYGFNKHKGYGTRRHILALEKYGASPVHRTNFGPVNKNIR